ncbi:hypothetical protein ScPMuIL_000080 [Solemya velum]
MLPRLPTLSVCLSCWRKLPIITRNYLKTSITHKYLVSPVCSSTCGLSWFRTFNSSSALLQTTNEERDTFDVTKNPYYSKYKEKLKQFAENDPDEFVSKVKEMNEKEEKAKERRKEELSKPADLSESRTGLGAWPPKSLNEIMKVELIKDKTAEEIERIWAEYHASKDCVFAIVKELDYDDLSDKSKRFQQNVPAAEGECPTLSGTGSFYRVKEDKGIVLMAGQYDNQTLRKSEALNLVKQMTLFYGRSASERFNFVQVFNNTPEKFEYGDLVAEYKNIREIVES